MTTASSHVHQLPPRQHLFVCPVCGSQTLIDAQYLGKVGPCYACEATIRVDIARTSHNANRGRDLLTGVCWGAAGFAGLCFPLRVLPSLFAMFDAGDSAWALLPAGLILAFTALAGAGGGSLLFFCLGSTVGDSLVSWQAAKRGVAWGFLAGGLIGAAGVLTGQVLVLGQTVFFVWLVNTNQLFGITLIGATIGALVGGFVRGAIVAGRWKDEQQSAPFRLSRRPPRPAEVPPPLPTLAGAKQPAPNSKNPRELLARLGHSPSETPANANRRDPNQDSS